MGAAFYLGIDGGGTTSRARLTDGAGTVLGEGVAGSSNLTLGIETAAAALDEAISSTLASAGVAALGRASIAAGLGLAGANVPSLASAILAVPFGFASLAVESDAVAACLGAHGGEDGAILILGTGSQGLALVEGRATTVGGWGFALSDDGSGAILGRAALRAAIRCVDGLSPRSALCDAVLGRFSGDPAAAVIWAKTAAPRDYGAFAPLVFEHADAGDEMALRLVADSTSAVAGMLDRLVDLGARRIVLMGGTAKAHRRFLPARFGALLVEAKGDAIDGALALARRGNAS